MDLVSLKGKAEVWLRDRVHADSGTVFMVLTVAVFLALLVVLLSNSRLVWQHLRSIDYRYLCLGLGVHSTALGATALGWHFLVRQCVGDTSLRTNLRIFYTTAVTKEIPGVVWYLAGRVHLYAKEGVRAPLVVTCSFMETVWVFVSGVSLYLLLSPFQSPSVLAGKGAAIAALAVPLVVLVLRPDLLMSAINAPLRRLKRQEIHIVDRSPGRSLTIWLAYLAAWLLGSVTVYCSLAAVHPVPAAELPTVTSFAVVSGMAGLLTSVLPAGMGIREVSLAALLSYYVPFPLAVAVSILLRGCVVLDETIWAAVSFRL